MDKSNLTSDILPPDPDASDEDHVEYGRQLALHHLLGELLTSDSDSGISNLEGVVPATSSGLSRKVWIGLTGLAATVFVVISIWMVNRTNDVQVANAWNIQPVGNARFKFVSPNHVMLEQGELMIESKGNPDSMFTVETPNSRFTSHSTRSIIGYHPYNSVNQHVGENSMIGKLTRVLVLSGIAALSNEAGSVTANEPQIIKVVNEEIPVSETVKHETEFAINVYRKLAETNEENVFVSPIAISSVLGMLLDGARGETAEQIGNALGLPESARRLGEDSEAIPWETTKIYSGIENLNQVLRGENSGEGGTSGEQSLNRMRDIAANKRKALVKLQKQIREFEKTSNVESRKIYREAMKLSGEESAIYEKREALGESSSEYQQLTKEMDRIAKLQEQKLRQSELFQESFFAEKILPLRDQEKQLLSEVNDLLESLGGYEINIANAIWAQKGMGINPDYVKRVSNAFGTDGVLESDFQAAHQDERNRINEWVEEQTNGRIRDILPSNALSRDTRMVLTSAIYFQGDWESPFEPSRTRKRDFMLADGSAVKVPLMSQYEMDEVKYVAISKDGTVFDSPMEYDANSPPPLYPDEGFHILSMPYKSGQVSMVLLAPMSRTGLPEIESNLTTNNLNTWLDALARRQTNVRIPKFEMAPDYDIKRVLQEMGVTLPFEDTTSGGPGADFTGIVDPLDSGERIHAEKFVHKAFIGVNEKGTEAAAASVLEMTKDGASAPRELVKFTPMFEADRPFMFLIRHNRTGAILFMGRLTNPKMSVVE